MKGKQKSKMPRQTPGGYPNDCELARLVCRVLQSHPLVPDTLRDTMDKMLRDQEFRERVLKQREQLRGEAVLNKVQKAKKVLFESLYEDSTGLDLSLEKLIRNQFVKLEKKIKKYYQIRE